MIEVRQPRDLKEAEALADFGRTRVKPFLARWYCGGVPYQLEDDLAEVYADPNRTIFIAYDKETIVGYLIVSNASQHVDSLKPDPKRAAEALTALMDAGGKLFPYLNGEEGLSDEFHILTSLKTIRPTIFDEETRMYQVVDP